MYKEDCSEQSFLHTDAVISDSGLFKNAAKADNENLGYHLVF